MSPRHSAEQDRDRFDRWALTYDRMPGQNFFSRRLHEVVLAAAEATGMRPKRILDAGCGTGTLLLRAALRFPEAEPVGIDVAPGMIEVARTKVPTGSPARFEVAAAEQLPFESGSFDLAFSTISFHHWADPRAGLAELARVLRPGGAFVLGDSFLGGPFLPIVWLASRLHAPFPTRRELQRMFAGAGLSIRDQRNPRALAWSILITVGERR